ACQTALGQEVRGEGLVGLTRAFMYAGAPRVLASLWRVRDTATAELMTRFYRGGLLEGMAPPAALRAAQQTLLRQRRVSDPRAGRGAEQKARLRRRRSSDPGGGAPFTLLGDWRGPAKVKSEKKGAAMTTSPVQSYPAEIRTPPPRTKPFPAGSDAAAALVAA